MPKNRVPHLRDGFIVAKVGIAHSATAPANLSPASGLGENTHDLIAILIPP